MSKKKLHQIWLFLRKRKAHIWAYFGILIILTVLLLSYRNYKVLTNSKATESPQNVTLLNGGYQIGVVSLNLDKDVDMNGKGDVGGAKPLKEMLAESLAEGKKWDIVGLQEMKESHPQKPRNEHDTDDFIQIMQDLGQGTYSCVKQQEFSNDFFSVICSKYPIIDGSYREKVIWRSSTTDQARVFICVQIDSPAGILPVCTTHPRAGSDQASQFRAGVEYVLNTVLDSYIPSDIPTPSRSDFLKTLRARLILTGDMNFVPGESENYLNSACIRKWPGNPDDRGGSCDIDQVMYVNMAHPKYAHEAPFTTQYLVVEGGYRDISRAWPTDHIGPIVSIISTRELTIPISLTSGPSPSPISVTPTLGVSADIPNLIDGKPVIRIVNFNPGTLSGEIDPTDKWRRFAEYIATQNVEIIFFQEPGKREQPYIENFLKPYFPFVTNIKSREGGETNPILSRYPFVEGSQKEWNISPSFNDKRRVALSVMVETPYGRVRAVNLHTHSKSTCVDAFNTLEPLSNASSPYYNSPDQPFFITGDFNIYLGSVTEYSSQNQNSGAILSSTSCSQNPDYHDRLKDVIRTNYKALCQDELMCLNRGTIEMLWSMNGNPITIYKMWRPSAEISNQFNDINRHPIVYAEIGDPSWVLPATPSPTSSESPTIQSSPTSSQPSASPTQQPIATVIPTVTATPTPPIENIEVSIAMRLQGISTHPKGADSIQMDISVLSEDKSIKKEATAQFRANEWGLWKGSVKFDQINLNNKYKISMKGEKHLKMVICENTPAAPIEGTLYTCTNPAITFQTGKNDLNFENIILRAGDIADQNGVIDSYDLTYIRNNLGSSKQDVLIKADLNLDGILDTQDYALAIRAMDQKLDQKISE